MYLAYPYNPQSTIRVEETATVEGTLIFLKHIPKKGSVQIEGFTEVDGAPQPNQFFCDYALDSLYRDANRVLQFNTADNGRALTVNYVAIGTVLTADIWNEIKAHIEDDTLHGGEPPFFNFNGPFVPPEAEVDFPTTPLENNVDTTAQVWTVDAQSDESPEFSFVALFGRPSKFGDFIHWSHTGSRSGWAFRSENSWVNLENFDFDTRWNDINPFLSVSDRQKLDSLTEPYQIGDGFYLQNNKLYLQIANANSVGGVKVGDGLQLNNSAALCLKAATASQLGGVKIGNGLVKDLHDVLSVDFPLSNADRKLLDYLHEQLDDQIDYS